MSHYWTIASACYSHLAGQTPTKPGLAVLVRPTGSQWDEFHERSRLTGNSWKDSNVCQARVARMMPLMSDWMSLICAKSWSLVTSNSYCHFWNWAFIGIWHHVMVLVYLIYSYFQLSSVWGTTDWQPRAAFQGKTCLFHWWFQVPLLLWLRCYWQISWEGSQQFTTILGLPSGHFTQHHTTIWYGWPLYRWFPPETKRGDGTKGRQRSFTWICFPIWFPIWFPMVSQYGRGFNRSW